MTNKGFASVPVLIGIILALSLTTATAGYFGGQYFNLKKQSEETPPEPPKEKDVEKEAASSDKATQQETSADNQTPTSILVPTIPTTALPVKTEDISLKIERCRANREAAYNKMILEINQGIEKRLQEVFDSLQEQYRDEVSNVYDSQIAEIMYQQQQAFWYKQKRDIESAKQVAIDELNILLDNEYNTCLSS